MTRFFSILILLSLSLAACAEQKTIDQLKAEAEHASSDQQGRLYAEIADRLGAVADKQFTDGESVKGHASVQEILQYATKAHDLVIETRKKMKETEKSLRGCHRRLENMKRTLAAEDRPRVEAVEKELEDLRKKCLNLCSPRPRRRTTNEN